MEYVLVCDEPIVSGTCATGFRSEQISATFTDAWTLENAEGMLEASLYILAVAYGVRIVKKIIWDKA